MENTQLMTDLTYFIGGLPILITKLTSYFKPMLPEKFALIIPFIPLVIGVGAMVGLWAVFGGQPVAVYIINGLWIALGTAEAYNEGKKKGLE